MEFKYSTGNKKIGKDTVIFNMGSATECSSKKAGLCDIDCYALKAEIQYKNTLPARQHQEKYWLANDSFTIAEAIQKAVSRNTKVKITHVRVNESGDFHTSECLDKLIEIAEMLPKTKFYTYTHRSDLIDDSTHMRLPKNLVINTSDFNVKGLNQFKAVDVGFYFQSYQKKVVEIVKSIKEKTGSNLVCRGDCSVCSLCKISHGKEIFVAIH